MDNRYNLVDEKWIPIVAKEKAGLRDVFSDPTFGELGGTPIQKIALTKLLLAIAQTAATPQDDEEWKRLTPKALAAKCLAYIEQKRDCFWLYGASPFLQTPAIAKARPQPYGALVPNIAATTNTLLFNSQQKYEFNDAERAMIILQINAFALGGKKTDNKIVLSPNYAGKMRSGKVGPSLGPRGYQHAFYEGDSIWESLLMNLFTHTDIQAIGFFLQGLGTPPPWETPPQGENDEVAKRLRASYMGRLLPYSRFALMGDKEVHYSEGVAHHSPTKGMWDPSMSVFKSEKKTETMRINSDRRPWRELPALLSFVGGDVKYECYQIQLPWNRICKTMERVGMWVGGLQISNNAGEQYCSEGDDAIHSHFYLRSDQTGEIWYHNLSREMEGINRLSRNLSGSIRRYHQEMHINNQKLIKRIENNFWLLCERQAQRLIECCAEGNEEMKKLRGVFASYAHRMYNQYCPDVTAGQMLAWAKHRPLTGKYVNELAGEQE